MCFFLFSFILSKISKKNYRTNFKLKKSKTKQKQKFSHSNFFKNAYQTKLKNPNWCTRGKNKDFLSFQRSLNCSLRFLGA